MDTAQCLNEIRKDFYRYKNGVIADRIRCLYPSGVLIYGLTVPDFVAIADKCPKDFDLAQSLWRDTKTRESRLLSLYLMRPEDVAEETAEKFIMEVRSPEEAEFLAFKLLRFLPYANGLYEKHKGQPKANPLSGYCIEMLGKNLGK